MSTKAQVLEDNGGGIHWVTADGRSCSVVEGVHKKSPQAGQLVGDLATVEDWIDDARNDRPDEADTVSIDENGMTVIAEIDDDGDLTIRTEHMGASGRAYAGIGV